MASTAPENSPAQDARGTPSARQEEPFNAQGLLPGDREHLGLAPKQAADRKHEPGMTTLQADEPAPGLGR